jgi:hypothetical protein
MFWDELNTRPCLAFIGVNASGNLRDMKEQTSMKDNETKGLEKAYQKHPNRLGLLIISPGVWSTARPGST